jgi:RND family efflux transporter MFP subunit
MKNKIIYIEEMVNTMVRLKKYILCLLLMSVSLCGTTAWADDESGVLQWVKRVELTTPVSGVVSEVLVDSGSRIKKGDVLLRLDARGFKARVKQARAELQKASDVYEEAQRELQRTQELFDRTVMSIHELQLEKIASNRARAEYEAAQARLVQAELEFEYSVIRAPFDVLVLERQAQPGQTVVSRLQTSPLLVVAAAQHMKAQMQLSLSQLKKVTIGQQMEVRVEGDRYMGVIRRIGLDGGEVIEEKSRYPVDIEFAYPEGVVLRAGQEAEVTLP